MDAKSEIILTSVCQRLFYISHTLVVVQLSLYCLHVHVQVLVMLMFLLGPKGDQSLDLRWHLHLVSSSLRIVRRYISVLSSSSSSPSGSSLIDCSLGKLTVPVDQSISGLTCLSHGNPSITF